MACIIELLGMPPQKLVEQGKRSKNFISSKGNPRYCAATTLADGSVVLTGGKTIQNFSTSLVFLLCYSDVYFQGHPVLDNILNALTTLFTAIYKFLKKI